MKKHDHNSKIRNTETLESTGNIQQRPIRNHQRTTSIKRQTQPRPRILPNRNQKPKLSAIRPTRPNKPTPRTTRRTTNGSTIEKQLNDKDTPHSTEQ